MPALRDGRLDRSGHVLVFDEAWEGPDLDPRRWIPTYLPHWSSRARTTPRYRLVEGNLRLRIDADTPEWAPEWDPGVRVANLTTAVGSGPVGSGEGMHRFRTGLVVREAQPRAITWAPHDGLVEVRVAAARAPDCLTALWMIGLEDVPERSGELCVVELFGHEVGRDGSVVRMGIHPFGDPALVDDLRHLRVPFDTGEPHDYAVAWEPGRSDFFIDDAHVLTLDQAPDYPLALMLDLYELPPPDGRPSARTGPYPKEAVVHHVRGYAPRPRAVGDGPGGG
ncbi:MAG TPA: glycoside hydrolase family 16 protein [Candidatus Limnocylindrales bacterium]